MEILDVVEELGIFLAQALSILAIIYVPMIIGARWMPKIDDKGFFLIPIVWVLAIFTGVGLGAALIAFNLPTEFFTVDNIFRTDGPWALSYSTFIRDRVNPFNYSFEPVLTYLRTGDADRNLTVVAVLVATAYGLLVVRAVATWRSLGALRGIIFGTAIVVWALYMTLFSVCLLLWLLNLLSFWSLAVITMFIHLYRSRALPFSYDMLAAPVTGGHGHGHGHGGHGHNGHGHNGHGHGGGHGHNGHGHGGHGHGGHGHGGHDHDEFDEWNDVRADHDPINRMLHP